MSIRADQEDRGSSYQAPFGRDCKDVAVAEGVKPVEEEGIEEEAAEGDAEVS
jgi:hypothetical protein